jgi:hypothetical protein
MLSCMLHTNEEYILLVMHTVLLIRHIKKKFLSTVYI